MQGQRRPRKPGARRYFPRRKVCYFSAEHKTPDYKDVTVLRRFISEWGKIEGRRKTGTRAPHQRKLATDPAVDQGFMAVFREKSRTFKTLENRYIVGC